MAAPTRAALETWLEAYVRLWNAGDQRAWLENHRKLVTGDVTMEDPVGTRVKRGAEACFLEPWQRFNSNTKFELRDVFICGSEVAFVNDNHWTHEGKTTVGTSIEIYRFEPDGSLVIRTWWEVPQDREIMREYVS